MTEHTPLTDQQLDDIETRVTAAEDGWHVVIDETNPHRHEIHGDGPTHVAVFGGEWDDAFASYPVEANAEFAAHARRDVPLLLAEVRRRVEPIALPAHWDCAHGPSDDEAYCAAEDDHVCPTIRVHPSDAEQFAALVAEVHRLRAEAPVPVIVPSKDTPLSEYDFVELVAFAAKVENEGFGYAFEEYPPHFEAPELAPIADDYSLLRELYLAWEEALNEFWTRPDAEAVYDAHIDEARRRRREQRATAQAAVSGE